MKLVLATGNENKVEEIRHALQGLPIKILGFRDFPTFPSPEETGVTLLENALIKARAVARFSQILSLADDTGLHVDALAGAPGVYSSRFAGPGASYEDNWRKLLTSMEGLTREKRTAVFTTVAAFVRNDGKQLTVEGRCPGFITDAPRGTGGFGYDPVFEPAGTGKTFAELSLDVKNSISHRADALRKARKALEFLLISEGKYLVGITGNIGCGKSTVAQYLSSIGYKVLNADSIGHAVLERPDVCRQIVQVFGREILTAKHSIDRNRLREALCQRPPLVSRLTSITHPLIQSAIAEEIQLTSQRIIFVEAALIFESSWDFFFTETVLLTCSRALQTKRVLARARMDALQLSALLSTQLPQEKAVPRADYIISNNESLELLRDQVDSVLESIRRKALHSTPDQ